MDKLLMSLKGISNKTAKKLEEQGIKTVPELLEKASTPQVREALSATLGVDRKVLNSWVKQAELLSIPGIDSIDADLLNKAGIRNVEDLANANTQTLQKMIKTYTYNNPGAEKRAPAIEQLDQWKKAAKDIDKKLVNDPDDEPLDFLLKTAEENTLDQNDYIEAPDVFFEDMADMIINLGKGIAEAQHALDMNAVRTQEEINDDEVIRSTGIMATWYAIPEATFNLKMNYAVVNEQSASSGTTEGKKPLSKRIVISPMNAKYQNYFKVNESMQSELNLKFVPVPPPTRLSQVNYAPDLIGKTLEEAKKSIAEAGLVLSNVTVTEGIPSDNRDTQVVEQSLLPGNETRFNDKLSLKIYKKTVS
jgi:predicted flap endonuclease-1-like 5' DNA nuclease